MYQPPASMDSLSDALGRLPEIIMTATAVGLTVTLNLIVVYITWKLCRSFVEYIFPSSATYRSGPNTSDTKPTTTKSNANASLLSGKDSDEYWYPLLLVAELVTLIWSLTPPVEAIVQKYEVFPACLWSMMVVWGIAVGFATSVAVGTLAVKGIMMTG